MNRTAKLLIHYSRVLCFFIAAICLPLLFCAKLEDERQWDNPADPSGMNFFPPEIVSIDRPVFDAFPEKSFEFSVPGTDNENAITNYFWSFDNGINWESTGQVSHNSTSWDTFSIGPQKILVYITDIHDLKSRIDTIKVFVNRYEPDIVPVSDKTISQSDTFKQILTGSDRGGSLKYYWDINVDGWDDSLVAENAVCSFSRPEGGSVYVHWAIKDESNFIKHDTFTVYFNKKPFQPKVVSPANDTIKKFATYDYTQHNGSVVIECAGSDPDDNDSALSFTFRYGSRGGNFDSATASNRKINLSNIKESSVYSYKLTVSDRWKNSAFSEGHFIVLPPPPKPEGMIFVKCQDTVFLMGQRSRDSSALPLRDVKLSKNFWIDTSEITVRKFARVLSLQQTQSTSALLPATNITWFDAVLYCNARSKLARLDTVYKFSSVTGTPGKQCKLDNVSANLKANGYRLPTEAEWEFACRGGTSTLFFWGNDFNGIYEYAWNINSAESKVHEVVSLKPNPLGIYDMAGNVWEWCHDWYDSYQKASFLDPSGASSGTERVLRGGSAASPYYFLQSGIRNKLRPEAYNAFTGFRAVLPAP